MKQNDILLGSITPSPRCVRVGWYVLLGVIGMLLSSPMFSQTVISDPSGDASGNADIIAISGGYDASNLYLTATFQPGTLNPANLGFIFGLDTDQNSSTGFQPGQGFFPIGAEFSVFFNSLSNMTNAGVHSLPSDTFIGNVPVTFGTNMLSLTVPLSMLGNDDGLMNFGMVVGVPNDSSSFSPFDFAPDSADNGPLGGPTSAEAVPEPSASLLLVPFGLAMMFWMRRFAR